MSTKTCVTGNTLVLHKALLVTHLLHPLCVVWYTGLAQDFFRPLWVQGQSSRLQFFRCCSFDFGLPCFLFPSDVHVSAFCCCFDMSLLILSTWPIKPYQTLCTQTLNSDKHLVHLNTTSTQTLKSHQHFVYLNTACIHPNSTHTQTLNSHQQFVHLNIACTLTVQLPNTAFTLTLDPSQLCIQHNITPTQTLH